MLKVQPTTVALATTDVFASPHCSTQNWTGLAELIMHSCKSCPQYFSDQDQRTCQRKGGWKQMHPTNTVPQNWLENKVLPQVDTELSFSIFFLSDIPPKKKSYSKNKRFFFPSSMFEVTTERRQTSFFNFCCKWTSLINGHV